MIPLKFEWKYIAGIKMSQSSLRKYQDEDTGVVKEVFHKVGSDQPEHLYYIPSDTVTVTDEDQLIKRIDTLLQQAGMKRISRTAHPSGSFRFVNSKPVFTEIINQENNLFKDGKIVILRGESRK